MYKDRIITLRKYLKSLTSSRVADPCCKHEPSLVVKCYHSCKNSILNVSFWMGVTLSFPIEHFLWEKVFPFNAITKWLGL